MDIGEPGNRGQKIRAKGVDGVVGYLLLKKLLTTISMFCEEVIPGDYE
jgi:hypothetical protein